MCDSHLADALRAKIDTKTKPLGALGRLESLAFEVGTILGTTNPTLTSPTIVIFAGDHGIAAEGVSAFPSEVTAQMVAKFSAGGAAINVFARQNGLALRIVDAGVAAPLATGDGIDHRKVAPGTRNCLVEPAMTHAEVAQALAHGSAIIAELRASGCNVVGFGEMGIANTSAAALLMALTLDLPIDRCVGAGTGLDGAGLSHKRAVLERALNRATAALGDDRSAAAVLAECGGLEIAMMVGAMVEAAQRRMIILVDGFIATSAVLVAQTSNADVRRH